MSASQASENDNLIIFIEQSGDFLNYFVTQDGDEPHKFTSQASLCSVEKLTESMLNELNGLLAEWSATADNRDEERLKSLLQVNGARLASDLLGKKGQSILANYAGRLRNISIITLSETVRNLPWNLLYLPCDGSESGFFLAEKYLIARPIVTDSNHPRKERRLPNTEIVYITHTEAEELAKTLGYTSKHLRNTSHLKYNNQLETVTKLKSLVSIVCQSTESSLNNIELKPNFGLILALNDNPFTVEYARIHHCPAGCLVALAACKAAKDSFAQQFSEFSQCSVLAPIVLIPADMAFQIIDQLVDQVLSCKNEVRLSEILTAWSQKSQPLSMLFRLYGSWNQIFIGEKSNGS